MLLLLCTEVILLSFFVFCVVIAINERKLFNFNPRVNEKNGEIVLKYLHVVLFFPLSSRVMAVNMENRLVQLNEKTLHKFPWKFVRVKWKLFYDAEKINDIHQAMDERVRWWICKLCNVMRTLHPCFMVSTATLWQSPVNWLRAIYLSISTRFIRPLPF